MGWSLTEVCLPELRENNEVRKIGETDQERKGKEREKEVGRKGRREEVGRKGRRERRRRRVESAHKYKTLWICQPLIAHPFLYNRCSHNLIL